MTTQTTAAPADSESSGGSPHPRRAALCDVARVSPGVIPFGVMLGVTVVAAGTGAPAALLGAVLVYGGSAQLTTLAVLHAGSGAAAAVLSGVLVNSRLLFYGAALEPRFRDQPLWFKLLAPQFLLDQTYLSAVERPDLFGSAFRRYWGWLGLALLAVWTASVGLGLAVGPLVPPLPHLGLVAIAMFLAMLVPRLITREALVAAGVSVVGALLASRVVPELGIVCGTAIGVAAAITMRRRSRS